MSGFFGNWAKCDMQSREDLNLRALSRLAVFETAPFDHLGTAPRKMEERVRFELTVAFTTPAFQAGALDRYATAPCMAERTGLEPANEFPRDGLASRCLTIRLPLQKKTPSHFSCEGVTCIYTHLYLRGLSTSELNTDRTSKLQFRHRIIKARQRSLMHKNQT